jgi:hypothetical protein
MKNMHKMLFLTMLTIGQLSYSEDRVVDYVSQNSDQTVENQVTDESPKQESYWSDLFNKFMAWLGQERTSLEERHAFYADDRDSDFSKEVDRKWAKKRDELSKKVQSYKELPFHDVNNEDELNKNTIINHDLNLGKSLNETSEVVQPMYSNIIVGIMNCREYNSL